MTQESLEKACDIIKRISEVSRELSFLDLTEDEIKYLSGTINQLTTIRLSKSRQRNK